MNYRFKKAQVQCTNCKKCNVYNKNSKIQEILFHEYWDPIICFIIAGICLLIVFIF